MVEVSVQRDLEQFLEFMKAKSDRIAAGLPGEETTLSKGRVSLIMDGKYGLKEYLSPGVFDGFVVTYYHCDGDIDEIYIFEGPTLNRSGETECKFWKFINAYDTAHECVYYLTQTDNGWVVDAVTFEELWGWPDFFVFAPLDKSGKEQAND